MVKAELKHRKESRSDIYAPTRSHGAVASTASPRILDSVDDGSVESAVTGLLKLKDGALNQAELERIEKLI